MQAAPPVADMVTFKSIGSACTVAQQLSSAALAHTTCVILVMISTIVTATHPFMTATASIAHSASPTRLRTKTLQKVASSLSVAASADQKKWKSFNREMSIK